MPHCLYVFGCWLNRTHGSFLYFSLFLSSSIPSSIHHKYIESLLKAKTIFREREFQAEGPEAQSP